MENNPDSWKMVKIVALDGEIIFKVVAGWYGGYLDGGYWKVNSGIVSVEETEDQYIVHGNSGAIYNLGKGNNKLISVMSPVYNAFINNDNVSECTIEDVLKHLEVSV